jgi:hypothetical protein
MYVEDLINRIWFHDLTVHPQKRLLNDDWQRNFVQSICDQIDQGKPLSTRQSVQVLKIIDLIRIEIISRGWATEPEILSLLLDPQYHQPLYESVYIPKEVRYLGGHMLAFRFKDRAIVEHIKALAVIEKTTWLDGTDRHFRSALPLRDNSLPMKPRFEWLHKIWLVPVYRHNLKNITSLITKHRFAMDNQVADYLRLARRSVNQPSLFATDGEVIFANVCDNPLLSGWITAVAAGVAL